MQEIYIYDTIKRIFIVYCGIKNRNMMTVMIQWTSTSFLVFPLFIRFLEVSAIYCFVEYPKPFETQYYSLNEILTNPQLYHQKSIDRSIESFFIAVNIYGYIHSISRIYTMNRTSYYILVELAPSSQDEQDDSFFYIRIHHLPLILQLYTFCNIYICKT